MKRLVLSAIAALASVTPATARYHHHYSYHRTHHRSYGGLGPSYGPHYTNVDGNSVHSPMHASRRPSGATAHCSDGTWSFSQHARGTCSHHGGVG